MKRQLENDSEINRPAKRFMSANTKTNPIVIDDEIFLYEDRNVKIGQSFTAEERIVSDSDDDLVITVKNITSTQRVFDETIVKRKQEPQIINFDKIGKHYIFDRPLHNIPNVSIDCRNVFHHNGKYIPKSGGDQITLHNSVDVAHEIMSLIDSIPSSCGTFCVLTDLLGVVIVNTIASELYILCRQMSRRIIIISYTGDKPNGDDLCNIKLNMPIITNDRMDKYEDIYYSERESHNYRFVKPPPCLSKIITPLINDNRRAIKSY